MLNEVKSLRKGLMDMVAYELFSYDDERGYEFIGILPERRKNPKRITKESVVNWGKMILGSHGNDKKIFFNCITIDDRTGKIFEVNLSFNDD